MDLLVDTHIFLWSLNRNEEVPGNIKAVMTDANNRFHVSIASLWEATIKLSLGKLSVPGDDIANLYEYAAATGTQIIPIRAAHLEHLQKLPLIHKDPFDRLIVAQAAVEGLRVVSVDRFIRQYLPDTIR